MTLENLLKIGQLKSHVTDATEVRRLLDAATRNLADAHVKEVSAETRFDAAYKAIMQSALTALLANGYRPDTNRPGHHMTVLQSLPTTIGLARSRMVVLDTYRRKRNLSDYLGEDVDDISAANCIREAEDLLREVTDWLRNHRPELIS